MEKGTLYLIPVPLGESAVSSCIPEGVIDQVKSLSHFIVENEKTARRHLKSLYPEVDQSSLYIEILNLKTKNDEIDFLLEPCMNGLSVGLLSEAGCPAVADPGALLIRRCHHLKIPIKPFVGPSSILLTLMASGLNGQQFSFNGYLPHDAHERKKQLKSLERESLQKKQTQLFMETPYRNDKLLRELLDTLSLDTLLTVGVEMSLNGEEIHTKTVAEWLSTPLPDLHKRPSIFALLKES
ncbi:MAG: SAM-dependent methyltransferase [Flavobacteriaceae bacterium]|jgi:16S rRNA (cytidine1402-2'-O)-methyltransferase